VDPSLLEDEVERYSALQESPGFPKLYWNGEHDYFRVMALELLGPSLEDMFAYCEYRFSLKTTLMIADQILERLEEVHSHEILHRDIKPPNLLLGSGVNGNVVYLVDFGLSEDYVAHERDVEKEASTALHLIGTDKFASVRGHRGLRKFKIILSLGARLNVGSTISQVRSRIGWLYACVLHGRSTTLAGYQS
jgi:serine/threonine protein kinase